MNRNLILLLGGQLISQIGDKFHLLTAQILISVCSAFFDPAIPAVIPQIVKKEQLTRANSQAQFISGISTIAGPVLGGLTVAWAGYLPVFAINACSYLFSAAKNMRALSPGAGCSGRLCSRR